MKGVSRLVTIMMAGTLLVAACGASEATPPPTADPGGPTASPGDASAAPSAGGSEATPVPGVPIAYWLGLESTDPESVAAAQALIEAPFEALHPDVDLQVVPMADEGRMAKVQTALAAGTGPDIVDTAGSSVAIPLASEGYLLDLGPLGEREGWKDTILPWAYDMGVIDGKLQALPTGYESLVIYYNKTLFDEHGWKPPTDRASFEALANEMQALGIKPIANGNADYQGAGEWLVSAFMNQVAGPGAIHDALTGDIRWTDQRFVDAMQLLVDYFDRGYVAGGLNQYFTTTFPQLFAQLANGEAGMYISGSWEMVGLGEYFGANGNTAEWAWAPLPPLADGIPSDVYPLSVGGTLSVNAASKNVPGGEAYVAWFMSDTDTMWDAVIAFGNNPLPIKFDPATVPSEVDPRYVEQYQAINEASAAKQVGYVTWTSWGGRAETYILENMDSMFSHDLSPADFQAGMDEAFQEDLADGLIPPVFDTDAR